jgi:hypothetical protein
MSSAGGFPDSSHHFYSAMLFPDCLCGLAVRVLATDPEVLGSIPGASRFFEKQRVWNGVHSAQWGQLRSYLEEKVEAPV